MALKELAMFTLISESSVWIFSKTFFVVAWSSMGVGADPAHLSWICQVLGTSFAAVGGTTCVSEMHWFTPNFPPFFP